MTDLVMTPEEWEIYQHVYLSNWPNCSTPDCEWKQCAWSGLPFCFKCSERTVGRDEMIRRYNATHDITWDEAERLEKEEDQEP